MFYVQPRHDRQSIVKYSLHPPTKVKRPTDTYQIEIKQWIEADLN